jgi:hypothetical protein
MHYMRCLGTEAKHQCVRKLPSAGAVNIQRNAHNATSGALSNILSKALAAPVGERLP